MHDELERGQRVGDCVIESLVETSPLGSVYRGVQPDFDQQVTIKVIHQKDAETASKLIDEARAMCAMDDPDEVSIFAFGQLEDGRPYLVTEWPERELEQSPRTTFPIRSTIMGVVGLVTAAVVALQLFLDPVGRDPHKPRSGEAGRASTTSPSPAPAQPVEPASPSPRDRKTVTISFDGLPNGTTILSPSGAVLATTPDSLELPQSDEPVELRLEKSDFLPGKTQVVPNRPRTMRVVLKRRPPQKAQRPAPRE